MSPILYQSNRSPFAARVRILAAAKGISLEYQLPPGGLKSPEYLAINPLGKVPCLVDGGFTLPESETICEYLEDAFPEPSLRFTDPQKTAKSRLISRMADIYVFPALAELFGQLNPATRDEARLDQSFAKLDKALGDMEPHVEGPIHAVGDKLSLADCTLVPYLYLIEILSARFERNAPMGASLKAYMQGSQNDPHIAQGICEMHEALEAIFKY